MNVFRDIDDYKESVEESNYINTYRAMISELQSGTTYDRAYAAAMQTELADDGMLTNTDFICNTCCNTLMKSKITKKHKVTQQVQVKAHQTDDNDADDMAARRH